MRKEFTLTKTHIELLSKVYVAWDDCATGAPCIDPKRPYGNSNVIKDMYVILTGKEDWYDLSSEIQSELQSEYLELHGELETALQIILYTKSFVPGIYEEERMYGNEWKLISKKV